MSTTQSGSGGSDGFMSILNQAQSIASGIGSVYQSLSPIWAKPEAQSQSSDKKQKPTKNLPASALPPGSLTTQQIGITQSLDIGGNMKLLIYAAIGIGGFLAFRMLTK